MLSIKPNVSLRKTLFKVFKNVPMASKIKPKMEMNTEMAEKVAVKQAECQRVFN